MSYITPIYTKKANCKDCYKCVRNCPVKAIKVNSGSATIVTEPCIVCGACVEVCPAKAKTVRDDLTRVKQLVKQKVRVIASLAPSFVNEYDNIKPEVLIASLKRLGFWGVSETALGAQEVSANIADMMCKNSGKVFISSACPTVVELIKKYKPEYSGNVTDMMSPVLTHSRILKDKYGKDVSVVFIGPCISKKDEADMHPQLLEAALTYEDLRKWFEEEGINPAEVNFSDEDKFIPEKAFEGALYSIEGGMRKGIKANAEESKDLFMNFSGIQNVLKALQDINSIKQEENIFLELLACEGGCVNGPKAANRNSTVLKRLNVMKYANYNDELLFRKPQYNISEEINIQPITGSNFSEEEIKEVLKEIGMNEKRDAINCAGCGYNTCNEFVVSLLNGRSEKTMCVSYMRQLAQKKANALMKTMPSGVVIVDHDMKIVECNYNWARLMGEEAEMIYDVKPGIEGAYLEKIIPFSKLFKDVLETGVDIIGKEINYNDAILLFSIFTIEKRQYVGGIFRDVTEPWVRKEQIIKKAKAVIRKNLSTVQKIAYLLGENAAESEVILNSIIDSFSTQKIERTDK